MSANMIKEMQNFLKQRLLGIPLNNNKKKIEI